MLKRENIALGSLIPTDVTFALLLWIWAAAIFVLLFPLFNLMGHVIRKMARDNVLDIAVDVRPASSGLIEIV